MDATYSLGQPRVLISRTALLHNVKLLRSRLAPGTRICAMVKADAYGHGAQIVADTLSNYCADGLEAPAVDALAVVTLDEADALDPGPLPILVLRPVENVYIGRERERLENAIRQGWTLTVGSIEAASDVARIALAANKRASVQIMIDTGIHREGAPSEGVNRLVEAIESQPALKLSCLCTHFVSAEEAENPLTADQLRRFRSATESHAVRNPKLIRHAANSGALFFTPSSHLDMVRPGIALFGIDPTCRPSLERPLRPVLKWTAPLTMIRALPKGQSVGYNQTWRAVRDTRLGLVPVGYADGYLRSFSNRAMMLVHGQPAPVVGRVSMDYTAIDLTDVPHVQVGDEVIVLDSDPLSPASVYALAKHAQTISYEIFCHIGPRVHRMAEEVEEKVSQREVLNAE